ncbi:hypothetical protein H4582DRAFT_134338 [Lactarius indigo]|nr:hypothetical protein H4582DRAFT_134338 [Lactarius indigo]
MWIITGPFDGEALNEVGFQKSKVLKSGKSYRIGRKSDCDLAVNHKKVSHDHGQFVVGGFSPDDVTNTGYTPTLRILNSKNKTMRIWREGVPDGVIVNPGAMLELQHDDRIDIVSGLPLTVQWQRICCFETPGKVRTPIPIDGCASLGVHVVRTLHPDITHHLVPSHALSPAHMTSLLSAAQLVKPEWLSELLDLSILDPRETPRSLEHTFVLPSESRFRPGFAADLPTALKTLRAWEPNETRLNMLKGYRFVFAGDKGFEVPAGYREVVKRGGAEYEAFAVSAGVVRWRKALVRAKTLAEEKNAKVVVVADGGAMELAVGADEWDEMVSVAKSLELEFILPENILQAIAYVDTFYVDSAATAADSQKQSSGETPLPDVVPNTLEAEPSFVPPIDVRPARKAPNPTLTTSELPPPVAVPLSGRAAPESESQTAKAPLPRRLPPRRATERKRTTTPSGGGDDAVVVEASQTPAPPPEASQLPTPVSQVSRLPPRRRANKGVEPSSALLSSNPEPLPSQSAQLDKYKALFDASNPDHASSETQQTGSTPVGIGMLSAVPEEQESQSLSQSGDARGTKRSRTDDDAEMVDISAEAGENAERTRLPKRRAVNANSVHQSVATQPKPNSTSTQAQNIGAAEAATTGVKRAGAAKPPSSAKSPTTNKLDTDEDFLKAVNSMKRGKKLEDDFDREFNQLRITNPKAKKKQDKDQIEDAVVTATTTADDGAATSRPWDAIDDFGDVGLRGNFMVVVEMDVQRGGARSTLAARNQDDAKSEWVGRSNFKKFKKKSTSLIERRPTVELVVSEENDYGIGNAYWKSGASGSQSHSDSQDITAAHPPLPLSKSKSPSKPSRTAARGKKALTIAEDEDESIDLNIGEGQDDEMDEETFSAAPAPKTTRSKAGTRAKAPAPASPTKSKKPASKASTAAKTKAKTKASKGKGKQQALFLSDPSDEEGGGGGDMAVDDEVISDGGDSALVSELVGDDRETSTLRSTAGTQVRRAAARGAKKRPAAVLVDPDGDSDDDAVFKGFSGRKRGRIG